MNATGTHITDSLPIVDEIDRARVMALYDLAGARTEGGLDDLVRFAAELCQCPVALVSVVEEQFQTFMARAGTTLERTPRSQSFCAHAMYRQDVMEVPDTHADARFVDNPLVTGAPFIRFYAGAPLVSREGIPLGAICVIGATPRPGLDDFQRRGLRLLASAAMGRLEERRTQRDTAAKSVALADSEQRFRTLADAMPQMVWSTLPDGFHDYYNARWYEFTGVPAGSTEGEAWNDMFHPDDQTRAWERWRHSLATGDPYQIEYRLRHADGDYRWVLGRALAMRDDSVTGGTTGGAITRWFGTCTDIHEQKLALEEREVISQELSHRIKNIFAVIAGLIQFAARAHPALQPIAADLRDRITALGRAHDFVRPHSPQSRPAARQDSLHGLLADLFEPYQTTGADRIAVEGADIAVDDRAATPLALLFHELATNATKYGALSAADGAVAVSITVDNDTATISWAEHGGPAIVPPRSAGFGSQLIEMSAVRQLGGTIEREWKSEGLVLTAKVPLAAFSRARRA